MFKKLRNRFLILNLVVISVMTLGSFTSIYLITYKNVRFGIEVDLHEIEEFYFDRDDGIIQLYPYSNISRPIEEDNDMPPYVERSVSLYLKTDKHWNTITKSSIFDIGNDLYESAKKAAISQNSNRGNFTLDNEYWAFMITPVPEGYKIIFLDITSQQRILTNLIYAFLIVTFIMMFFIYFISIFFTERSIYPIKEAFDKQKQFVADASHELKTPLAVINTNVDVLLSNGEDTINSQSKWLNYIKSESERMTKLAIDLLYLTQMDYSDIKMVYTKFNLSKAVEYVILTMEAVIYEHDISLNYDIEPKLITHGNDEQIQQVIMILLDNAIKYTNKNGIIDISLTKYHNDIILSMTNTGDGIPEEHLGKVFDRFYRADKSRARRFGGYGLGLSIAKAIIDQHKGKIYAESILSEGMFHISCNWIFPARFRALQ